MMNHTDKKVVVVIISDNNPSLVERTMDSVFNQTYKNIKIMLVDNSSTDGTYEKLVSYLKNDTVSLYRLSKKHINTRLFGKIKPSAIYIQTDYITIIEIGDVLDRNFIANCVEILSNCSNPDVGLVLSEVDFIDAKGSVITQKPILSDNEIFTKNKIFIDIIKKNIGHKLIGFYNLNILPQHLSDAAIFADYYDFFRKIQFIEQFDIYYSPKRGCFINSTEYKDIIEDIVFRFYYVIKMLTSRKIHTEHKYDYIDDLIKDCSIYYHLSQYTLGKAHELKHDDMISSKKLLKLSEIIYDEIVKDDFYKVLKNEIQNDNQKYLQH
jgi:glycosyltransferase involved in cell wall biosynthesis